MPRLPVAQELGVRSFQDRSSVTTPHVDFGGTNAFVSAIDDITSRRNERLDASSLHKAKITFQKAKLEADAAFDQDPDFETYQERYDKKLETAVTESAAMVRNPRDRETFQRDMSLYRAQGTQNIIAKAFGKEVDRGLADLNETEAIARENFLRASNQQDKDFAIQISSDAINAAVEATHITEDEGQKRRQAMAIDLAMASIEMAPPEKKIKLLKSRKGVMEYIPMDRRTVELRSAYAQLDAQTVLNKSNDIRIGGGTLEERMAKVNKIKDPNIKGPVRSRVIADTNVELIERAREDKETYDRFGKELQEKEGRSLDAIIEESPKEWSALGLKEQSSLRAMDADHLPTVTDPTVYRELSQKKGESMAEAHKYYLKNVSSFSSDEQRRQDDIFASLEEAPKPLRDMESEFNSRIDSLKIKVGDGDWAKADQRLRDDYEQWAQANPGETLGANTQKRIIDSIFDEVVIPGTWFGTNSVKGYNAPKNKVDAVKVQKEIERFRVEYNNGKEPTVEDMAEIERVMRSRGLLSKSERD